MSEMNQTLQPHPDDDRMLDLAHGLLEGGEADACLTHLKSCPECEQRFRVIDCDREYQRAKIAACVAESNRPPLRWRRLAKIAAGFAGLGLALTAVLLDSPVDAEFWLPVDAETLQLRSGESAARAGGEEWAAALAAYERHEVDEALQRLQEAHVPPEYEDVRSLFLAHVLVLSGRSDEALALLAGLDVPTLPPPWRERAERIEALASAGPD